MALRARNPSPRGLATLKLQSTCHGPRPEPKLACGVRAGSLRATELRARGKTRGRKRKKCRRAKKTHLYIYTCIYAYRVLLPQLLLLLLCVARLLLLLQQQCCCFLLMFVIVCRMAKFGARSLDLIPEFLSLHSNAIYF